MDLNAAERMARALMAEHLAEHPHVRFRWGKGTSQLAMVQTKYNRRTGARDTALVLHRPYAASADEASVRNTILHEIAHVLCPPTRDPYTGKRDVHGAAWKACHIRLGGNGQRCGENPSHSSSHTTTSVAAHSAVRERQVVLGDRVRVHLPNSKWDGTTGPAVTVTDLKVHVGLPGGGKLMVPRAYVSHAD